MLSMMKQLKSTGLLRSAGGIQGGRLATAQMKSAFVSAGLCFNADSRPDARDLASTFSRTMPNVAFING
jgi:hypothetical protein